MNGDVNESADLELRVTDNLNDRKVNGNSYTIEANNKSNYESLNYNSNCDSHQLNSLSGLTENGNGYVPIAPRKQNSYNLNTSKSKRCSSCATKICIFCTGFIIGLLLSLLLLSALQYFSVKSPKIYNISRNNESLIAAENIRGLKSSSLNITEGLSKFQLIPSGRSMKNFSQSEMNGNISDNDINKTSVNEISIAKSPKVTTLEPHMNDSDQTQGHDQGLNDVDDRTTHIGTLFPDNFTFDRNSSGIDLNGITIKPEVSTERAEVTTERAEVTTERAELTTGRADDRNSSEVNNYNSINELLTVDSNEANNHLSNTSTASSIDLEEGNELINNEYTELISNNSFITPIPDYPVIDNGFNTDSHSDSTTETAINNSSKTINILTTDLAQESQTPTESSELTPTQSNDLTPTEKSIELLTEWKSMANTTDSDFSPTSFENMLNSTTISTATISTATISTTTINIITSTESPTTISNVNLASDPNLNNDSKPNLAADPHTGEDLTTEGSTMTITDDLDTSEPVFVGLSSGTPSLVSAENETVTETVTPLPITTMTDVTNSTDLSFVTTLSDIFNDTLYLNDSDASRGSDIESNDSFSLLNQNKTFNDTIQDDSDFNATETDRNNSNNTLELELTTSSQPIYLNQTTIAILLENTTQSMPSLLNQSLSTPPQVYCLSTQFSCPNETHRCLDNDLICDGVIHCTSDGFDERDCGLTNCSNNFRCNNSLELNSTDVKCISHRSYCDGIWDCNDGSDELGCHLEQCQNGEFLCRDGSACIKAKQACDFTYNCRDHSDEIGCVSRTSCESMGRFYCDDGLCIEQSLRCDGTQDCHNGTDEQNCVSRASCLSIGNFFCDNGNCINITKRCNGINDCNDSSDEFECVRSDERGVVQVYEPSTDSWSILCAKTNFETNDADRICHKFGYLRSTNYTLLNVKPINISWADGILQQANQNLVPIHSSVCDTNQTVAVFCDNFKCGLNQRGQDVGSSAGLKSSEDVPPGLIIVDNKGHECPAQIVASKWLITSAQCVKNFSIELTRIKSLETTEDMQISKIQIHPHYSRFRSLRFSDYDIALVETKQTLNISEGNTVCLPAHQIDPEITCFVGTKFGDIPHEVIEKQVCNSSKHFNTSLTSRHFCANTYTQQSLSSVHTKRCVPDGSPLICLSSSSQWYIAGFASYQHGCNGSHFMGHLSHPTVFSNVYSMKDFIDRVIGIKQYLVKTDYQSYTDQYDSDFETTTNPTSTPVLNLNISFVNYEDFNETVDSNVTQDFNLTQAFNITDSFTTTQSSVLAQSSVLTQSSVSVDDLNTTTELYETENLTTTDNPSLAQSFGSSENWTFSTEHNTTPEMIITESLITTTESSKLKNSAEIRNLSESSVEYEDESKSTTLHILDQTVYPTESAIELNETTTVEYDTDLD